MPADCRHARSALQKWLESPVEIGDRATALKALAIYEERGRRVNAELLIRLSAHFLDLLMQLIVREALVKSLFGESGLLAISNSLDAGSSRTTHSSCFWNNTSSIAKALSPAQRASMDPASARMSSGNSRKIRRTCPVSMYFFFSSGSTLLWKVAQCGQVIEAYSTMVTFASGLPSTRSGNGPGFISSSTGTSDGPRR